MICSLLFEVPKDAGPTAAAVYLRVHQRSVSPVNASSLREQDGHNRDLKRVTKRALSPLCRYLGLRIAFYSPRFQRENVGRREKAGTTRSPARIGLRGERDERIVTAPNPSFL